MEGKVIKSIKHQENGYSIITFEDGSWLLVKIAFIGEAKVVETTKDEEKPEKTKKAVEEKSENDEDSLTGEDLAAMSYKAMKKLCKENDLDTDPKDFDEDEEDDFRKAIAKELGLELPEDEDGDDDPDGDSNDGDELTWEDLLKLDYDELEDLIDEKKLDTDIDDFEKDEEDKIRRAIAEELDIEVPKKEKKDKKDKKNKK